MKTIATLGAIGAALLIGSPAFAGYDSHHTSYQYQHSHYQHHRHYQPSYTYHKPTYYQPTYEHKKVEVCFKWVKEGYGHAYKVIIPCPYEKVIEKHVEKPVEKPVEQPTEPLK